MSTYVAAAETCPLLVRWAPKCICMHLSRQQRSGWKQNHTQEDTCSWASPLVTAKGSFKWTEECCHLRVSSLYCSPEERSLPLLQTSQILCAPRRAVMRLFLSKLETRSSCIKKWTLAVAVSTSLLLCWIRRVKALPLSERSPTQRLIQLCASLPPGGGFCYVPWLALLQGDQYSPQHNSHQLVVLDFTSYWLVTSRIEFWLVFINTLCLLWLL